MDIAGTVVVEVVVPMFVAAGAGILIGSCTFPTMIDGTVVVVIMDGAAAADNNNDVDEDEKDAADMDDVFFEANGDEFI